MTKNDFKQELSSIKDALASSKERLKEFSISYQSDSRVLLAFVTDKAQSWLLAHPEESLAPEQIEKLELLITKLESGIPMPYVIGNWQFFGLNFKVTPDTLIPRPETEMLVETALNWMDENPGRNKVLDIGTGTGCIPISISVHDPELKLTAVDISLNALNVAQENSLEHSVQSKIRLLHSDLFENVDDKFDLICSNPPYISTETLQDLEVFNKEPSTALDGGVDGLEIIRRILAEANKHLLPGGMILIEIEARQGIDVKHIASENFPSADIYVKKDLAGQNRLLMIQT